MNEAKFKIGDRVETNWIGIGKVTDVMYSAHKDQYSYEVTNFENGSDMFSEEELKLVPAKKEYSMTINIDIAHNLVIATLLEETKDGKIVVAKGHGHLIHEGEVGVAQAASYACKRLFESLDSKQDNQIYFKNQGVDK